jgi:hypothetical protein
VWSRRQPVVDAHKVRAIKQVEEFYAKDSRHAVPDDQSLADLNERWVFRGGYANIQSTAFGTITSTAGDARIVQLVAKYYF